jgi:hypothetical protein
MPYRVRLVRPTAPAGSEGTARRLHASVLSLEEGPKPPTLAGRRSSTEDAFGHRLEFVAQGGR